MPFNEPIAVDFVNDGAPITVHGSEGLDLQVYANEYDEYWSMKFVFSNNSGRPLYNVLANFEGRVDVGEISEMILYYSNGTTIIIPWADGVPDEEHAEEYRSAFDELSDEDVSKYTLNDGETLTGMYSVKKVHINSTGDTEAQIVYGTE